MKESGLTVERIRNVLDYNPETGALKWRIALSRRTSVGSEAGVKGTNGRRYVQVLGEKLLAHRLIWFYVHGVWPTANISPKNGDYDDLRLENLREQSLSETSFKGFRATSNKSGIKGVSWSSNKNRWLAVITRDYRRYHIGYFITKEEAAAAYEAANLESPDKRYANVRPYRKLKSRKHLWGIWSQLISEGNKTAWLTYDEFAMDIKEVPSAKSTIIAKDKSLPIGPNNWEIMVPVSSSLRYSENKKYRENNPDKCRAYELKRDFGITISQYEEMLSAQDGCCAVCERPERVMRGDKVKRLAVDHDHTTGKIRGLLCSHCNQAIGKFEDNPVFMNRASNYVIKHREDEKSLPNNVVKLKEAR